VGDLGCGTAHALVQYLETAPELRGVGVDIDQGSLSEAEKYVQQRGMSDRVKLVWGDITKPETYADATREVDAYNCVQALHEFMVHGQDQMVDLLRRTRELIPGKYFVITEFRWMDDQEFKGEMERSIATLYYQYIMHPFSWQGLPIRKEEWISIFERAGFEEIQFEERFSPFVTYVVRS
jgi:ubiquinone/menaquinone biosynthesis C-methylase UbiE